MEITVDGSEVSIPLDDRVTVRLAENPTTGYQWVLATPTDVLEVESDEFQPPLTGVPGAGGHRVIVFRAVRPGHAPVRLELRRAWESGAARTFSADVIVEDPDKRGHPAPP